jgi:hypothetical protein
MGYVYTYSGRGLVGGLVHHVWRDVAKATPYKAHRLLACDGPWRPKDQVVRTKRVVNCLVCLTREAQET